MLATSTFLRRWRRQMAIAKPACTTRAACGPVLKESEHIAIEVISHRVPGKSAKLRLAQKLRANPFSRLRINGRATFCFDGQLEECSFVFAPLEAPPSSVLRHRKDIRGDHCEGVGRETICERPQERCRAVIGQARAARYPTPQGCSSVAADADPKRRAQASPNCPQRLAQPSFLNRLGRREPDPVDRPSSPGIDIQFVASLLKHEESLCRHCRACGHDQGRAYPSQDRPGPPFILAFTRGHGIQTAAPPSRSTRRKLTRSRTSRAPRHPATRPRIRGIARNQPSPPRFCFHRSK